MKNEELLRAMGELSDDLVTDAAPGAGKKRSRWPRWAAAAACVCLVAAGGLVLSLRGTSGTSDPCQANPGPDGPVGPSDPIASGNVLPPDNGNRIATSDAYANLGELLAYLSKHDDHSARNESKDGAGSDAVRSAAGYTAVEKGGYVYHLAHEGGTKSVRISRLGSSPEAVGELDADAQLLFRWGDCLAAVGRRVEELSLDDPGWTWVKLYDLADPEKPALTREFSLLGGLDGCWQHGGSLYLLAADGVCACGYSRFSDPADYLPQLEQDGQPLPWGEEDVSILGEPSRVAYTAGVRIDLETGELAEKRAFYGDVEGIFHSGSGLALVTGGYSGDTLTPPMVYLFDNFSFLWAKLDTAALLGLSPTQARKDGVMPDGEYPYIVSVSWTGDTLQAVGYVTQKTGEGRYASLLLAAAVNLANGEANCDLLNVERFYHIGDLLWEEDRALLFVTSLSPELKTGDSLFFADFRNGAASLSTTGLTCDSVDGVDKMYSYGSPLGWLETVIPLGNGKYLRYNGTPDGLDLYDLSGDAPVLLRRSAVSLTDGGRFEFQWEVCDADAWEVYGANTVGVLAVWPNANGEYRNVTFTWDVYDVKGDSFTLLSRTPVSSGELTVLEYEGRRYLAQWSGALLEMK